MTTAAGPARASRTSGSWPETARRRRTIASRVLLSFAVTIVGFVVALGWSALALRTSARDHEELTKGYVPAVLRLGQLRATQSAIASFVGGMPDKGGDVLAARLVLEPLVRMRKSLLDEARAALSTGLVDVGSDHTRALAFELTGELDATSGTWSSDRDGIERLFGAMERGDPDAVNRELVLLGAVEHEGSKRLNALIQRVEHAMDELGALTRERERRSLLALGALAVATFGIGVVSSLHTRRLLEPLARVTGRAQAVARGDLTPGTAEASDDEIGELSEAFERMVAAVGRGQSRAVETERLAAIGKMAAHVTHEIRNPLSSIGLNMELLEEELAGGASDEARALLKSITREVQRLEHLSEEYLRVARLPSPRMEADDLAALARSVAEFVRPELERHGCRLDVTVDDGLPPVTFDEAQLRQALLNLVRNAREAMPDGGPLEVTVHAEGMGVAVSVSDRGPGVSEDILARVFDPFFSTKGEGTGLGLAITRQIVEAHGGEVVGESRPGGGAIFRVVLPIAAPRSIPRAPTAS